MPEAIANVSEADKDILVDVEYEQIMIGDWERVFPHKGKGNPYQLL